MPIPFLFVQYHINISTYYKTIWNWQLIANTNLFCIIWHQQHYILYNNLKLKAKCQYQFLLLQYGINSSTYYTTIWNWQLMANNIFFCIIWHQQHYILYKHLKLAAKCLCMVWTSSMPKFGPNFQNKHCHPVLHCILKDNWMYCKIGT